MSEEFSPAERAYFESRGADTSGLEAENAAGGPQTADSPTPATPTSEPQTAAGDPSQPQETPLDGEDGEEVVIVGKDGKPRSTNGRFVPHQALHKERERRKGVESELQAYREKMTRADERLAILNELVNPAGVQPGQPGQPQQPSHDDIDPEKDPLGALSQALAKVKALESQLQKNSSQQQEMENARAMKSAYLSDAERFVREKPEFAGAYQYLMEGRHRELAAMGMTDVNERNRFIADEERGLVQAAFQSQRRPAEMLYQLAVARGFAAQAAPAAPAKQDPAARIEQIARGQRQAGNSLSAAGGVSGEGLTAAALADMNEEEFAATVSRLGKAGMRRLMGG